MKNINKELITYLSTKGWVYESWIKSPEQLWSNLRHILNKINIRNNTLKRPLSDNEFQNVKDYLASRIKTPYFTSKFLYGINGNSNLLIKLDNGNLVLLTLFSRSSGNEYYQIVNDIKILTNNGYHNIDTLLLINGIPVIQIGVNDYGANPKNILIHMHNIQLKTYRIGLLSAVQILVGMSSTDVMYMANNSKDCYFNVAFSFHWKLQNEHFMKIKDWADFASQFLLIPVVQDIISNYIIVDSTSAQKSIKVMRPYQIYSTKKIIERLKNFNFDASHHKIGYIWHTTGSGKTISSFKAAWLAAHLNNVNKVIYLVDRVALSNQTASKYKEYDPRTKYSNNQVIFNTKTTSDLENKLDYPRSNIIVTSTQKLNSLMTNRKYYMPDKNVVFIVDEAHQGIGTTFDKIKNAFPHSAWVGYTGTPRFINKQGPTTKQVFGDPIDIYTIGEAISDQNVLGFHVNFKSTVPDYKLRYFYLPNYIYSRHPRWSSVKVNHKIDHLTPNDRRLIGHSIYDVSYNHIRLVVKDILDNWTKRSNNYKYNAIFTTHVSAHVGGMTSKSMVIKYYHEFLRQNRYLKRPLKIAVTFSKANGKTKRGYKANQDLLKCMYNYDKLFHTHFWKNQEFTQYKNDLISRLNKTNPDKHYLDLVIVINQLLTGFDAPQLNTLYVDRVLKGAKLIQAYSRTNRIYNMQDKPFGNIVTYRWPKQSREAMDKAFKIYNDPKSSHIYEHIHNESHHRTVHIIAATFNDLIEKLIDVVDALIVLTQNFTRIPTNVKEQHEAYSKLDCYNKLVTRAKQYDEYKSPDQLLDLIGLTPGQEYLLINNIAVKLETIMARNYHMALNSLNLKMEHIKNISINSHYLEMLVKDPRLSRILKEKDQRIQEIHKKLKLLLSTHQIKDVTKNSKASQLIKQANEEYEEEKAMELSKLKQIYIARTTHKRSKSNLGHIVNDLSSIQQKLAEYVNKYNLK